MIPAADGPATSRVRVVAVAIALALFAGLLRWRFMVDTGGLWRDEAQFVLVARTGHLGDKIYGEPGDSLLSPGTLRENLAAYYFAP